MQGVFYEQMIFKSKSLWSGKYDLENIGKPMNFYVHKYTNDVKKKNEHIVVK